MIITTSSQTRSTIMKTLVRITALAFLCTSIVALSAVDGIAQRVPSRGQTMIRRAPITPPPLSATERVVVEIRKAAYKDKLENLSRLGVGPQWPANPVLQRPPAGLLQHPPLAAPSRS